MKPFKQGDLDGLCGLYAAINAVRLTGKKVSIDHGSELLLEAVYALQKKPAQFITEGTSTLDLTRILRDALCDEFNIKRSKPFHKKSCATIDDFWEALLTFLTANPSRSAIISIETRDYSHWTVVKEITRNRIYLFDSGRRKFLNRNRCTIFANNSHRSTIIHPYATYFLEAL